MIFLGAHPPGVAEIGDTAPSVSKPVCPFPGSPKKTGFSNSLFVLFLMTAPLLVVVTVFLFLSLGL